MHSSTKRFARFAWTPAAALLLVAALLGYQSLAAQRGVVAPSVIATVNLERVFQNLDEKGAADIELQEIADDLEAEGRTMKQAIDLSEQDLDLFAPGSPKYQEALEEWTLGTLRYKSFIEFGRRKIDWQKANTLKRIYQSIKTSAGALAEASGYDMIFVDDSIAQMQPGSEAEMTRQISARRMLYTSPGIDVTDELVTRMNQAFQAGTLSGR